MNIKKVELLLAIVEKFKEETAISVKKQTYRIFVKIHIKFEISFYF